MSEWTPGNKPEVKGLYWVSYANNQISYDYWWGEEHEWDHSKTEYVEGYMPIDKPSPYVPPKVEEKPKECPFCGGELERDEKGYYRHEMGTMCFLSNVVKLDILDIGFWNRRAPIVFTDALGEKLREWHAEWVRTLPAIVHGESTTLFFANRFLDWLEQVNRASYSLDE